MFKERLNLRKVATIVACLVVTTMFASCDKKNGDDDGNPPASVGDPVSVKALVGTWWMIGWSDVYYWNFAMDGRFAYYIGTVANVSYWNEYFLKGKYRVNGIVIEFYDCQFDSYSSPTGRNAKYFNSDRYDMPKNLLLETSLVDPKNVDDFTVKFEFFNTTLMRIVTDGSTRTRENYDEDFTYSDYGDGHNVTIPTHTIPAVEWPKDKLPPDLPEYQNGRVRSVEPITNSTNGSTVEIIIDKTTREDGKNYIYRLIQEEGWQLTTWMNEASLIDFIESGGGFSLRKPGQYSAYFEVRETSFLLIF